jgi:hypothetical protein
MTPKKILMVIDDEKFEEFKRLYTRKRKSLPPAERGKLWGPALTELVNLSLTMAIQKLKKEMGEK